MISGVAIPTEVHERMTYLILHFDNYGATPACLPFCVESCNARKMLDRHTATKNGKGINSTRIGVSQMRKPQDGLDIGPSRRVIANLRYVGYAKHPNTSCFYFGLFTTLIGPCRIIMGYAAYLWTSVKQSCACQLSSNYAAITQFINHLKFCNCCCCNILRCTSNICC